MDRLTEGRGKRGWEEGLVVEEGRREGRRKRVEEGDDIHIRDLI